MVIILLNFARCMLPTHENRQVALTSIQTLVVRQVETPKASFQ